jgi:hypothetical protein
MKSYPNIKKSTVIRGEYVGYTRDKVFHIRKSKASSGNWQAVNRDNPSEQLFTYGLLAMSDKLANIK